MTLSAKAICLLLLFTGCKKSVEKVQQDLVINAMTDGQWVITNFIRDGSDITVDYSTYKFQFHSNKTVDAIKNGSVEKTGTWDGNASAMTISSNFPVVITPLLLINGSWHIDDNSWTFVKASQVNNGATSSMRLEKL